jgi:hypothetical protein
VLGVPAIDVEVETVEITPPTTDGGFVLLNVVFAAAAA